jgi:hypothetical protein
MRVRSANFSFRHSMQRQRGNGEPNAVTSLKGGRFAPNAKALHRDPFDGCTSAVADLEANTRIAVKRARVDNGDR